MSLLLRLAVGRGRSAVARQVLVVMGTALASALLLVATGIAMLTSASLSTGASAEILPDGTERIIEPGSNGEITFDYLVQPGLRRGVVLGFVLCVVPLLVFVATASRVAARRRDERLAGLRLAGATQRQVRALAILDTLVAGTAGTLLGALGYLVARSIVVSASHGQTRAIAIATTPSFLPGLVVLLLLLGGLAAGAALTLKSVQITPLGVVRRVPPRRLRPWGVVVVGVGVLGIAALATAHQTTGPGAGVVVALFVATMLGLVTSGAWITSQVGRLVAERAGGPVLVLAGRRLEDEPRAQSRAMSALVLVVLSATIGLVVLQDFLDNNADHRFYVRGFVLAGIGMAFSLVVGAAGLLLTTAEGLLERRRTLAALHAGGVPRRTLQRAVLAQVALPVLPASVLAVVAGIGTMEGLYTGGVQLTGTAAFSLLLPPLAVIASVSAASATLPFLRSSTDLELLRTT